MDRRSRRSGASRNRINHARRAGSRARVASQGATSSRAYPLQRRPTARISPKARRLAKELGVDIATVRGSGADGEILASDVQARRSARTFDWQRKEIDATSKFLPPSAASWPSAPPRAGPPFLISSSAVRSTRPRSMSTATRVVAEIEQSHGVRVTHTDLLVAMTARVLLKHPPTQRQLERRGHSPPRSGAHGHRHRG